MRRYISLSIYFSITLVYLIVKYFITVSEFVHNLFLITGNCYDTIHTTYYFLLFQPNTGNICIIKYILWDIRLKISKLYISVLHAQWYLYQAEISNCTTLCYPYRKDKATHTHSFSIRMRITLTLVIGIS